MCLADQLKRGLLVAFTSLLESKCADAIDIMPGTFLDTPYDVREGPAFRGAKEAAPLEYYEAIARSSAALTSSLDYRYWGEDHSLCMTAAFLGRRVFRIADIGKNGDVLFCVRSPCALTLVDGQEVASAEWVFYEVEAWLQLMRQDMMETRSLPLVIRYRHNHHTALLFDVQD